VRLAVLLFFAGFGHAQAQPEARILDLKHYSQVFAEERNFRVFLPPDYDNTSERYPVIYFFHGWSERHNKPPRGRQGYDAADDYGGDNVAQFVGRNKVIVVKWDGYNPRTPGEDYPRPYNISPVETYRQFPLYFPELVAHIDSKFRTIADREHRATAGLSMGGFMSFWISGKYPHLVGSASNFMGSSEFYAGPNGFPSEYRHTEMHRNYEGLRTRIVTGSKDFIRWYHRRMNAVWNNVRTSHEHEEFDFDHGTPGMAKTLSFHMKAFNDPLPRPALWHHSDVYPVFDVWGYSVQTDRQTPGFATIENVNRSGFRTSVREWLPGGKLLPAVAVRITTDALYKPGQRYRVTDVNVSTREVKQVLTRSDFAGRLHVVTDGALHEIGISEAAEPVVAVAGWRVLGSPWVRNGEAVRLQLELVNKGSATARRVSGMVSSRDRGARISRMTFTLPALEAGDTAETTDLVIELDKTPREMLALVVRVNGNDYPLELPVFPGAELVGDAVVLDGSEAAVWRRAIHQEKLAPGAGNGDGKVQAGEQVVLAIRDGAALRAVEVLTTHPCIETSERISDPWGAYDNVGATAKYTVLQIASSCAETRPIRVFVQCQLPSKPEHVLKQGVFSFTIGGKDTTAPVARSVRIAEGNRVEAVLRDGGRIDNAVAWLELGGNSLIVQLNDDGRAGDRAANDGVFTGVAPNPRAGEYSVRIEAKDEFGNSSSLVLPQKLKFLLPDHR
jgi:S-formylglutathione hydrolase FrmB